MLNFTTEKEKSNLIDIDKRELAVRSIFLKAAILNSPLPNEYLKIDSSIIPTISSSSTSSSSKPLSIVPISTSNTISSLQNISKKLTSVTLDDSNVPSSISLLPLTVANCNVDENYNDINNNNDNNSNKNNNNNNNSFNNNSNNNNNDDEGGRVYRCGVS